KTPSHWVGTVALLLSIIAADQLAGRALEPWVKRVRPCAAEVHRTVAPKDCPPGHSFPSRQSAAAAAGALVFSAAAPVLSSIAIFATLLVGASRVYLGESYPSDVAAGLLVGAAVGAALLSVSKLRFFHPKHWT